MREGMRSVTGELEIRPRYDVIIVGSGAGGMVAALRAHDLGMSVLIVEKSSYYGGVSAVSGGQIWIPCNHLMAQADDREAASTYVTAATQGDVDQAKLATYLDNGPEMIRYLDQLGIAWQAVDGHPDYIPQLPGSRGGRSLVAAEFDGGELGAEFARLRESASVFRLFGRYAMDLAELGMLSKRLPGWKRAFAAMTLRYWRDLRWRARTRRDRRLTLGNALIGRLRKALMDRRIDLALDTALVRLVGDGSRVSGAVFERRGTGITVEARNGVILAAGGYEQDQALRDAHLPSPTTTHASLAPPINSGDALRAGMAVGAGAAHLELAWWIPTFQIPHGPFSNAASAYPVQRHPHSICVNRLGQRFTNEAQSYARFGRAMIDDRQRTGANMPCWLIFDGHYRRKYGCGSILPSVLMSDGRVPEEWWDSYIFKAEDLAALAAKIGVPRDALSDAVGRNNAYSRTGKDLDFGRGDDDYDRLVNGDPAVSPNPALGAIDEPPYYAVRIDLGDIGTKGGLRTDASARVLSATGDVIEGLFAIGNCAEPIFIDAYPGPGGTLGPATVFGYVAAATIAGSRREGAARPLS